MLEKYRRSISNIYIINNNKAKSLNMAMSMLVIGVLLAICSTFTILWIKVLV